MAVTPYDYTMKPGDFVILHITCDTRLYIGQVKDNGNLKVVEEGSPYFNLKAHGDYNIDEELSMYYQQALKTPESELIFKKALGDRKLYSGLTSVFNQNVDGIREVIFE
jgi:hypothetical protein